MFLFLLLVSRSPVAFEGSWYWKVPVAVDDEEVPREFQGFWDRYDLEYRQMPAGIALYLGLLKVFLGLAFATERKVSADRIIGYWMLGSGAALLIVARCSTTGCCYGSKVGGE